MTDLNYMLTSQQTDPTSTEVNIRRSVLLIDPITSLVHANFDHVTPDHPAAANVPEGSTLCGEKLHPDTVKYLLTARVTCADCGEILVGRGLAVKMDASDAEALDAEIHAQALAASERTVTNRGVRRAMKKLARKESK